MDVVPIPTHVEAILLLPSGMRVHDTLRYVSYPPPPVLLDEPRAGRYFLLHQHPAGEIDNEHRALYVLGGRYMPYGAARLSTPGDTGA